MNYFFRLIPLVLVAAVLAGCRGPGAAGAWELSGFAQEWDHVRAGEVSFNEDGSAYATLLLSESEPMPLIGSWQPRSANHIAFVLGEESERVRVTALGILEEGDTLYCYVLRVQMLEDGIYIDCADHIRHVLQIDQDAFRFRLTRDE